MPLYGFSHRRRLNDKIGDISLSPFKPKTLQGDSEPLKKGKSLKTSFLNQVPVLQEQQNLPSKSEKGREVSKTEDQITRPSRSSQIPFTAQPSPKGRVNALSNHMLREPLREMDTLVHKQATSKTIPYCA
jgi:hypothetical protein